MALKKRRCASHSCRRTGGGGEQRKREQSAIITTLLKELSFADMQLHQDELQLMMHALKNKQTKSEDADANGLYSLALQTLDSAKTDYWTARATRSSLGLPTSPTSKVTNRAPGQKTLNPKPLRAVAKTPPGSPTKLSMAGHSPTGWNAF